MWITAAEGKSLSDLKQLISDRELRKGQKIRWVMTFNIPGIAKAFDLWDAETDWRNVVPPGLIVKDVHEEGGKGIVDMEADPAWLAPVIAFVIRNWVTILVAGFLLYLVLTSIKMLIEVAHALGLPLPLLFLIIGGVVLYFLVLKKGASP